MSSDKITESTNFIIRQAKRHVQPLKRGSTTATTNTAAYSSSGADDDNHDGSIYEAFFDIMGKVWRVADEYNLTENISMTNFVMFGPQSVGKTTLVERILKFPVAVVKQDLATTRPMVLVTRNGPKEQLLVKEEGGKFMPLDKKEVVAWVTQKMDTNLSDKKIFIEVTGPEYMNRRFVDLPGFQQNNDKTGSYEKILNVLRKELSNSNTIVVCIDRAGEFVSSSLVPAMTHVFGDQFTSDPNFANRFVLALNMSDKWLGDNDTTHSVFLNQIEKYTNHFGMVPILVGGSIDPTNLKLRGENRMKQNGSASFEEIVKEYQGANTREASAHNHFKQGLDQELCTHFFDKCVGFENFLGIVDRLVIHRDYRNVDKISNQLLKIIDEKNQELSTLKKKEKILENLDGKVNTFVQELLSTINAIMTTDSGNNAKGVISDKAVIKELGMTALEEELEFFNEYYDSKRRYDLYEHHLGCNDKFDQLDESSIEAWDDAVKRTVDSLKKAPNSGTSSISYLQQKLIGGTLYERSLAVWASTAYSFLTPCEDDLEVLANIVGLDPEISMNYDLKKAKRLAETYMNKIIPGLQYLCQKMEFILLKIFDVAWCSLERKSTYANTSNVMGRLFKPTVKTYFRDAVKQSARLAYNRTFFDLDNEIYKLLPYQNQSPSVTAMKYAFSNDIHTIGDEMGAYHNKVSQNVVEHYKDELKTNPGVSTQLKEGILLGISLLADGGVISPLIFAGITFTRLAIGLIHESLERKNRIAFHHTHGTHPSGVVVEPPLAEDLDQKALGFAIGLYGHFLPRFIASIDGRMRSEIWSSATNVPLNESIKMNVVTSALINKKKSGYTDINGRVKDIMQQIDTIEGFRDDIYSFLSRRPAGNSLSSSSCFSNSVLKPVRNGYEFSSSSSIDMSPMKAPKSPKARHNSLYRDDHSLEEKKDDSMMRSNQKESNISDFSTAEKYKTQGNAAIQQENFTEAIELYTKAIEIDESNYIYYSNRSAAYLRMKDGFNALKDAEKCVELNPDFAEGYSRKGRSLLLLERIYEAKEAYESGIERFPNDQCLHDGLEEVEEYEYDLLSKRANNFF